MANAPAPYPTMEPYYAVHVEGTNTGRTNTAGETLYSITITNVGNKSIINNSSISGQPKDSTYYTNGFGWGYYTLNVFENWAIAPGQSISFTTPISGPEIEDFSEYTWQASAYEFECPNITVTNMSLIKVAGYHNYKFEAEFSKLDDYYYAAIVEVTYKATDYAFEVSINKGSSRIVNVKEDLDLSQLEIKKATVYRSYYNTYKSKPSPMMYLVVAIMVGVILFISAAIAVPIIIVSTRKRNKNKNISK